MAQTNTPTIIGKAIPSLLSTDLTATKVFYQHLGFALSGEWDGGDCADWVELKRDQVVLQFYKDPPKGTASQPVMSGTLYFEVTGLEELAKAFSRKVQLEWGPELMDYGQKEFAIRDPSGYLLAFFETSRQ